MTVPSERNNTYWTKRLKKDGHDTLLDRVQLGEITVYKATQLAGYRKSGPRSPAAKLSYHWTRASAEERKRFVLAHLKDVNRAVREVADDLRALKAQKPTD
ncbi:hypothetical protein [Tsuneonella troitsensis]|uniref:hypothetical protein n=1 Tax=Tsuneonella troitsensis TaxID=292222 RepID=UPI00070ED3AA|nr:hypothetical protein [Tsuneonella troitsensis]